MTEHDRTLNAGPPDARRCKIAQIVETVQKNLWIAIMTYDMKYVHYGSNLLVASTFAYDR